MKKHKLAFPERPPRLATLAYGQHHPYRLRIIRAHKTRPNASWLVLRGIRILKRKASQVEAIRWAQRVAAGMPDE